MKLLIHPIVRRPPLRPLPPPAKAPPLPPPPMRVPSSGLYSMVLASLFVSAMAVAQAAVAPYGWGYNTSGMLGDGTNADRPSAVASDVSGVLSGKTITAIVSSATAAHTLALTSDGKVYAWGANSKGQLGNNSILNSAYPVAVDMTGALSGKTVVALAAGADHTLALTSDGGIYAWGSNARGALGTGIPSDSRVPVAVDTSGVLAGKTIVQIQAGWDISAVLDSTGQVYTWGEAGRLGNGSLSSSSVPVAVDTSGVLAGKVVSKLRVGSFHMLVQTTDGLLFGWGENSRGQIGDGTSGTTRTSPVAVDMSGVLATKTITDISAGDEHSLALASDGTVYAWGADDFKALGNATTTVQANSPVAVDMTGVLYGKTVAAISAGTFNGYALTSDGDLFAWGYNMFNGAVGDGTTTNRDTPVAVDVSGVLAGQGVISIQAGYQSCLVLAAPAVSTITPACRFTYAANFGWLNWRTNPLATDAPVIETTMAHGKVYAANVGWIDLGDGAPSTAAGYAQTGGDIGVNHDGAGALSGYAYGANIGWIYFDPTIAAPPRVDLVTGALSGYAYAANCGWINLAGVCTRLHPGSDTDGPPGTPGDGIPDAWELQVAAAAGMGSSLSLLGSTPGNDFDQDGVSDVDEYIADTNPFSATDKLKVTHFTYNPATGDVDLDWTGTTRRVYSVYCSSNLTDWSPVGSPLTGGSAGFTLGAPAAPHLFFRVQAGVPLQDP